MRSERRPHRARLKAARRIHWKRDLSREPHEWGRVVDTPTPCSCPMCGNPRRYFGETSLQERRAEQSRLLLDE